MPGGDGAGSGNSAADIGITNNLGRFIIRLPFCRAEQRRGSSDENHSILHSAEINTHLGLDVGNVSTAAALPAFPLYGIPIQKQMWISIFQVKWRL